MPQAQPQPGLWQQEPPDTKTWDLCSLPSYRLVSARDVVTGSAQRTRATETPGSWLEHCRGEPRATGKYTGEVAEREGLGNVALEIAYALRLPVSE